MGDPGLGFSDHVSPLCPSSPCMLVEPHCRSSSPSFFPEVGLFYCLDSNRYILNLTVFLYVLFWKPCLFSLKITKEYKRTSVDILIEQVQ